MPYKIEIITKVKNVSTYMCSEMLNVKTYKTECWQSGKCICHDHNVLYQILFEGSRKQLLS